MDSAAFDLSILIPIGSENETIHGISHLFEHLIVSKICEKGVKAYGYTTEDYVILFFEKIDIVDVLKSFKINVDLFEQEKQVLLNEISEKCNTEEEMFFREVWRDSIYERSPLGTLDTVKKINIHEIEKFKTLVLNLPLFYFGRNHLIGIYNCRKWDLKSESSFTFVKRRVFSYKKKSIYAFYFKGDIDILYVLSKVLCYENKDKIIQVSDKRKIGALLIEKDTVFPEINKIIPYKTKVFEGLKKDLLAVYSDFFLRAQNEVVSHYYYDESFEERILKLLKVKEKKLINLMDAIKAWCE